LATASRAINGSETRTVGEDLRRRVHRIGPLLGYAPNANAQAMARGATRTIGVVVHDLTDPYFAAIADGIATAATEHKLFLTLATTGNNIDALSDVVTSLDSMRVRAIILVGARWKDPTCSDALRASIEQYVGRGGRVVALGMDFPGVDCVQVANEAGASALAENLVDLGYRHPLRAHRPRAPLDRRRARGRIRVRGWPTGSPGPAHAPDQSDFTRTGGTIGMRLAIEARLDFDVVVATSDVMALGALNEASRSGIRIPEDAGLTGFGDITTLRRRHNPG
jgi:LacI family transcriptional regulator